MSVPEAIRQKLELYALAHGGQFDIGPVEYHVRVAVKFHPHTFSLAWMFAEDVFQEAGIEVELRPSLLDTIVEPDARQVVPLFFEELRRFADEHGGRFIFAASKRPTSPTKFYCDFGDEEAAVDWLGEMITLLSMPAVPARWSRVGETERQRIVESGTMLGG